MDWDAIGAALLGGLAETDWSTVLVALLGIGGTLWAGNAADRRAAQRLVVERDHRRDEQDEARGHEEGAARRMKSEAAAATALERIDDLWNPLRDETPEMEDGYELKFDKDRYRAAERAVGFIRDEEVRELVAEALYASVDIWYGFQFGHLDGVPYVRQRNAMGHAISVLQAHIRGDEPPLESRRVIAGIAGGVRDGRDEHERLIAESYESRRAATGGVTEDEAGDAGDSKTPPAVPA